MEFLHGLKVILVMAMILAAIFKWCRGFISRMTGWVKVRYMKRGAVDTHRITEDLIWVASKRNMSEIDESKIAMLKEGEEIVSERGRFIIRQFRATENSDLLIAAEGYRKEVVTDGKSKLGYADVGLHYFLLHLNSSSGYFEIKTEVTGDLADKIFKRQFADALFDFLIHGTFTPGQAGTFHTII